MIPILSTLLPVFLALLIPLLPQRSLSLAGKGIALTLAALASAVVWATLTTEPSSAWRSFTLEWVPSLGVDFRLTTDALTALMLSLVLFIGSAVFAYASEYLKGHRDIGRFWSILLLFLCGMNGILVSDNLFVMFLFWELTSVTSYLLIGFNHEDESSRTNALQALLVTATGGVVMLLGFITIYAVAGTANVTELLQSDFDFASIR